MNLRDIVNETHGINRKEKERTKEKEKSYKEKTNLRGAISCSQKGSPDKKGTRPKLGSQGRGAQKVQGTTRKDATNLRYPAGMGKVQGTETKVCPGATRGITMPFIEDTGNYEAFSEIVESKGQKKKFVLGKLIDLYIKDPDIIREE